MVVGVLVCCLMLSLTGCGFSFKLGNPQSIGKVEEQKNEISLEEREKALEEKERELEEREKALDSNNDRNEIFDNTIPNVNQNENSNIDSSNNSSVSDNSFISSSVVESSENNPAKLGEFVKVKVYNASTNNDEYISVCVDEIIKGDKAAKMVKDYLDKGESIYKYTEPESDTEWVVFKIIADFSNYTLPSYGKNGDFHYLNVHTVGKSTLYSDEVYGISTIIGLGKSTPEYVMPDDINKTAISFAAGQVLKSPTNPVIELGICSDGHAFVEYK